MRKKYSVHKGIQVWWVMMADRLIVETFSREEEANAALVEYENGARTRDPKWGCWIVADVFVTEPRLDGMQIGEVQELDLRQFEVKATVSQESLDEWVQEYYEENGNFPDS